MSALGLAMLPVLFSCAPPAGWGTDVTATSLKGDQWQVHVVITKHLNAKFSNDQIVSAPTLICRSGESAQIHIGDGNSKSEDLISVHVDTAEDPGADEMTFTVMVREGGLLRSRTSLTIQPDDNTTASAMDGEFGSK